jgi:hypothetical protein
MTTDKASPGQGGAESDQPAAYFKLDQEGIPILEEVVEEEPQAPAQPLLSGGDEEEIRRLARAIAAEAAVEFAREIEGRLMKELTPLLERKLQQHQDQ